MATSEIIAFESQRYGPKDGQTVVMYGPFTSVREAQVAAQFHFNTANFDTFIQRFTQEEWDMLQRMPSECLHRVVRVRVVAPNRGKYVTKWAQVQELAADPSWH